MPKFKNMLRIYFRQTETLPRKECLYLLLKFEGGTEKWYRYGAVRFHICILANRR